MELNQISDTVNHGVIYVKVPGCFPKIQQKFLPYPFGIKKKINRKCGLLCSSWSFLLPPFHIKQSHFQTQP